MASVAALPSAGENTELLRYIKPLDGLRAIAALTVIVDYTHGDDRWAKFLHPGALAVKLFFVLSSFLHHRHLAPGPQASQCFSRRGATIPGGILHPAFAAHFSDLLLGSGRDGNPLRQGQRVARLSVVALRLPDEFPHGHPLHPRCVLRPSLVAGGGGAILSVLAVADPLSTRSLARDSHPHSDCAGSVFPGSVAADGPELALVGGRAAVGFLRCSWHGRAAGLQSLAGCLPRRVPRLSISHGLYLYHAFLMPVSYAILGRFGLDYKGPTADWYPHFHLLLTLVLTVGIASLSWRFIEQPLNALKRHFPYRRPPLPAAAPV